MSDTYLPTVRLRRDAVLVEDRIDAPFGSLRLKALPSGTAAALAALAAGETTESALAGHVTAGDGETGLMRWHLLYARLAATGLLEHAVTGPDGHTHARLAAHGRGSTALVPAARDADHPVRLSRFAVTTAAGGVLAVRAPGSPLAVELAPAAAHLLGLLSDWTEELPLPLLRLLTTGGVLTRADERFADPESTRPGPDLWHPLDLAFHTRTRTPAASPGYGGSYPGKALRAPSPPLPCPATDPGSRSQSPTWLWSRPVTRSLSRPWNSGYPGESTTTGGPSPPRRWPNSFTAPCVSAGS